MRGLASYNASLHVFPDVFEILSTKMTKPTLSMGLIMLEKHAKNGTKTSESSRFPFLEFFRTSILELAPI